MTLPLDHLLRSYNQASILTGTSASPSFSVVVRTQGRRPDSLNEALDSITAQTLQRHETLVVVHGPDDVVARVQGELGPRASRRGVQVLGVEGGSRATPLNTGLDAASGDYICFLDDDDLVMTNWLAVFADAAATTPTAVIRAVTLSQPWATDGSEQPVRSAGAVERPFPSTFDLLAHMSLNLTPNCSLAFPRAAVNELGLRFDEALAVYEDWEFLMRAAMALGVTSRPEETSLYRRLDRGNADTAEDEATWRASHAAVVDRLSDRPVLLPPGDARRLARSHFTIDGGSRHETDLEAAQVEIDGLTRSPIQWIRAFSRRAGAAIQHRSAARRP